MKKIVLLSFISMLGIKGVSQISGTVTVNAGPDKCASPSATLTATATITNFPATTSYSVAPSPSPNWITLPSAAYHITPQNRPGIDDTWFKTVNIGFPFTYFGNTYTQLLLGINGRVTFDLSKLGTYEAFEIGQGLPGVVSTNSSPYAPMPNNTICALYRDLDPIPTSGQIYTQTIGTAPCRQFVVIWSMPLYQANVWCSPTPPTQQFQLVLNESTNIIDVNIQKSTYCPNWNGGNGIVGIQAVQNGSASLHSVVASHNGPGWSVNSLESWRFTPNGAVTQVPYTGTITWTNQSGAVIGTGASITVSPTTGTLYWANVTYTNCSGTYTVNDAVYVNAVFNPGFSVSLTPASNYFTLAVTPTDVSQPDNWDFNYCHRIEGWNSTYTNFLFKIDFCKNGANWHNYPNAEVFRGFDHTTTSYSFPTIADPTVFPTTPAQGKFKTQYYYRIYRAVANNFCGWRETYANISYFPAGALYEGNVLTEAKMMISDWKDVAELENTPGYNAAKGAEPLNEFTDLFYIYPNPSQGVFFVDLNSEKEATLQVVDMSGRVIKSIQLSGNDHYSLDLSGFSKGAYMLKVNGEKQQLKKVILE